MSSVLEELHRDHMNFGRVLRILGEECAALESGQPTISDVMREALRYLREYIHGIHHAKEDAIYTVVEERYPDCALPVHELLTEHRDLYKLLSAIESHLHDLNGEHADTEAIAQRLRSLLEVELAHLYSEEQEVFPLLDDILDEDDSQQSEEKAEPEDASGPDVLLLRGFLCHGGVLLSWTCSGR